MSDLKYSYAQATEWLFTQIPMFQNKGAEAYKPGLQTTLQLSQLYGNPHKQLRAIHVGGTNGKGSTSHTIAAVLQSSGYKVGLYTSPHLIDFRERIRVNGEMIPEKDVIEFIQDFRQHSDEFTPSFFELSTIMAFRYFANQKVDVAVIEVGLGGRLDSTNILKPILSIITNVSLDHTQYLGDTEEKIAAEKAGIIKEGIPIVIGESSGNVRDIFQNTAEKSASKIIFADDEIIYSSGINRGDMIGGYTYTATPWGDIDGELSGECQLKNTNTILHALQHLKSQGWSIPEKAVKEGFARVTELTGLRGRWMKLSESPLTICDTGHNIGGWKYIVDQMKSYKGKKRLVLGFVNDKDVRGILTMITAIPDTDIFFTNASIQRALPAEKLCEIARSCNLSGKVVTPVSKAYELAKNESKGDTTSIIFIGGSTFVVAELLNYLEILIEPDKTLKAAIAGISE